MRQLSLQKEWGRPPHHRDFENHTYGRLTPEQEHVVQRHVKDLVVTDLGAFQLFHSKMLLELGASSIIAVDKLPMGANRDKRIRCVNTTFDRFRSPIEVAFVSWPNNDKDEGLLQCIRRASIVIMLSKNTDGTVCGHPSLYTHLTTRKLLDYVPDEHNCLIVVGPRLTTTRAQTGEETGEEIAGIRQNGPILSFDDAEELSGR